MQNFIILYFWYMDWHFTLHKHLRNVHELLVLVILNHDVVKLYVHCSLLILVKGNVSATSSLFQISKISINHHNICTNKPITSTNFCRWGNIRQLQFTKKSVIWNWLDIWKFWKYPLKAYIKGKFWGGDLEKPTQPHPPNRQVQYFNEIFWLRKNFTAG